MSYAHPAIKELIHILIFSKKAAKRPLASQDLEAFDPIPLPLIAYACTAVRRLCYNLLGLAFTGT